MVKQLLSVACLAVALVLFVGTTADSGEKDKDKTHTGTVVSVKENKLTMTEKGGKEHSHDVPATAKVTIDGREGKLADLKPGTFIRVTTAEGDRITRIEADTKKKGAGAKGEG